MIKEKNTEIWKDVPNYEGLYQASNLGNVRSLDRVIKLYNGGKYIRKGVVLKQSKNHQGYMRVNLLKNGKNKVTAVHRIVASTFIENPYCFKEVNHKNEIKDDNSVENLEWCTQEYNKTYGTGVQRRTEKISRKVNQYNLDGSFLKTWKSMREVERELGISNQTISLCCLGKRNKAGGFKWRYFDE